MAVFFKYLFVLALLAAGAFFLLKGFGIPLPLIKYHGLEGYQVPAGVVLLGAGIALAAFWKIETEESSGTETTLPSGIKIKKWRKTHRTRFR